MSAASRKLLVLLVLLLPILSYETAHPDAPLPLAPPSEGCRGPVTIAAGPQVVLVGCPTARVGARDEAGSVHVLSRSGAAFTLVDRLAPPLPSDADVSGPGLGFGFGAALVLDGTASAVVGSRNGAVHVVPLSQPDSHVPLPLPLRTLVAATGRGAPQLHMAGQVLVVAHPGHVRFFAVVQGAWQLCGEQRVPDWVTHVHADAAGPAATEGVATLSAATATATATTTTDKQGARVASLVLRWTLRGAVVDVERLGPMDDAPAAAFVVGPQTLAFAGPDAGLHLYRLVDGRQLVYDTAVADALSAPASRLRSPLHRGRLLAAPSHVVALRTEPHTAPDAPADAYADVLWRADLFCTRPSDPAAALAFLAPPADSCDPSALQYVSVPANWSPKDDIDIRTLELEPCDEIAPPDDKLDDSFDVTVPMREEEVDDTFDKEPVKIDMDEPKLIKPSETESVEATEPDMGMPDYAKEDHIARHVELLGDVQPKMPPLSKDDSLNPDSQSLSMSASIEASESVSESASESLSVSAPGSALVTEPISMTMSPSHEISYTNPASQSSTESFSESHSESQSESQSESASESLSESATKYVDSQSESPLPFVTHSMSAQATEPPSQSQSQPGNVDSFSNVASAPQSIHSSVPDVSGTNTESSSESYNTLSPHPTSSETESNSLRQTISQDKTSSKSSLRSQTLVPETTLSLGPSTIGVSETQLPTDLISPSAIPSDLGSNIPTESYSGLFSDLPSDIPVTNIQTNLPSKSHTATSVASEISSNSAISTVSPTEVKSITQIQSASQTESESEAHTQSRTPSQTQTQTQTHTQSHTKSHSGTSIETESHHNTVETTATPHTQSIQPSTQSMSFSSTIPPTVTASSSSTATNSAAASFTKSDVTSNSPSISNTNTISNPQSDIPNPESHSFSNMNFQTQTQSRSESVTVTDAEQGPPTQSASESAASSNVPQHSQTKSMSAQQSPSQSNSDAFQQSKSPSNTVALDCPPGTYPNECRQCGPKKPAVPIEFSVIPSDAGFTFGKPYADMRNSWSSFQNFTGIRYNSDTRISATVANLNTNVATPHLKVVAVSPKGFTVTTSIYKGKSIIFVRAWLVGSNGETVTSGGQIQVHIREFPLFSANCNNDGLNPCLLGLQVLDSVFSTSQDTTLTPIITFGAQFTELGAVIAKKVPTYSPNPVRGMVMNIPIPPVVPGNNFQTPITALTGDSILQGFTVLVSFDPSILQVVSIDGGSKYAVTPNLNDQPISIVCLKLDSFENNQAKGTITNAITITWKFISLPQSNEAQISFTISEMTDIQSYPILDPKTPGVVQDGKGSGTVGYITLAVDSIRGYYITSQKPEVFNLAVLNLQNIAISLNVHQFWEFKGTVDVSASSQCSLNDGTIAKVSGCTVTFIGNESNGGYLSVATNGVQTSIRVWIPETPVQLHIDDTTLLAINGTLDASCQKPMYSA